MPAFILDVGHGNCAIVREDNHTLVIDAGPGASLMEFLKAEGISNVDVLLISHADQDHIAGLIGLLSSEEFTIGKVRLNTDSRKASIIWDDLLFTLSKAHNGGDVDFGVALTVSDSNTFNFGAFKVEILAPSIYLAGKGPGSKDRSNRSITSNSVSAVIRVLQNDRPILVFTGDIDNTGFLNMMEYLTECQVDATAPVIVFPHHGGKVEGADLIEFTKQVCNCIQPNTVVFSIGRGRYSTPQPNIIKAIKEVVPGARIVCTQLSEHCASMLPENAGDHLVNTFSAGKTVNACCAGTIIISLENDILSVAPFEAGHAAFISTAAPTALCRRA